METANGPTSRLLVKKMRDLVMLRSKLLFSTSLNLMVADKRGVFKAVSQPTARGHLNQQTEFKSCTPNSKIAKRSQKMLQTLSVSYLKTFSKFWINTARTVSVKASLMKLRRRESDLRN